MVDYILYLVVIKMQEIHDNLHHRVITGIEVQRLVVLGITALGNGASMMIGIMDPPRVFIVVVNQNARNT